MHHIFIGLGGTGVRVWQAMERRRQIDTAGVASPGLARARTATATPAAPVLLIDTDASLHDDEAPGWCLAGRSLAPPRAQRLLLASTQFEAGRAEILAALSSVTRLARDADGADGAGGPPAIHLIAHPGEPVGLGLLLGVLDALRALVPPARLQLHLTLSEQTPLLAALQQRAEAVPPGFDRCWLSTPVDERGTRETDAALRQERQAQWLLQAWTDAAPATAAGQVSAPRGEFALWGLAEWRSDLVAVQRHLGHALMLRLLAQLRFDHWRPGLGYVNQPAALRAAADEGLPEDPQAWPGASPEATASPPPPTLAAAQQEWQRLAAHYLQLVQHCAPAQRREELRRLFALGLAERFGGAGLAAAFAVPASALRQRAAAVRAGIETALWQDWRLGHLALRDGVARVAAQVAQADARLHDLDARQARDDRQVAGLQAQIDAEVAAPAPGRWFGPREGDLHAFALRLQAWAQASTAQAHTALLRRQWAALRAELADLQDMVDATELSLAALAGEADEAATAALAPPASGDGFSLRLDTREQVRALGQTWVLAEAAQRESVAYLRADLFTRLGDGAGFRQLAQHLGERAGCARLLATSTQRLAPSVVASAAQGALLALARAWQDDPAARPVALQRLGMQAGAGAWSMDTTDTTHTADTPPDITDTLRLPLALLPALPVPPAAAGAEAAEPVDPAELQRAAAEALRVSLQALPMPWPVGTLDVRLATPHSPAASSVVWRRQIAPVPLAALRGLQAPEPAAADHAPDHRPGLLLLGEALGLVREDLGAGVVLVRLDGEGFEADRVVLGAHWDAAAIGMPEPVRCWLQEDVDAALRASPVRPDRLRDVMQRRVAQLLAAAPPEDADGLRQRWSAAVQTAMHLLPA
ncbi:MAG: hypothetical protein RJB37_260 [Pseudomonadota bacterium]